MHSPSLNILGTFFPSWMLCCVLGIVGAAAASRLLSAAGIDQFVGPRLIVYPCIGLVLTVAVWLGWYGN